MALFDMIHKAMTPSVDENLVHDHESDLNEEDRRALESLGLNDHSYDNGNQAEPIPSRRIDAMEALSNIEAHNERTKEKYASNPDVDTSRSNPTPSMRVCIKLWKPIFPPMFLPMIPLLNWKRLNRALLALMLTILKVIKISLSPRRNWRIVLPLPI